MRFDISDIFWAQLWHSSATFPLLRAVFSIRVER